MLLPTGFTQTLNYTTEDINIANGYKLDWGPSSERVFPQRCLSQRTFAPWNRFYLKLQTDGRHQITSNFIVIDALYLCSHQPLCSLVALMHDSCSNRDVNCPVWGFLKVSKIVPGGQLAGEVSDVCWLYFDIHLDSTTNCSLMNKLDECPSSPVTFIDSWGILLTVRHTWWIIT